MDVNEFIAGTGIDSQDVEATRQRGESFAKKFGEIFRPELERNINEIRGRADRLNQKEAVVLGIPNGVVYYGLTFGLIYLAYKTIF